jgi:FSR family fosmidomycin resistance protein-like MFS transporter
LLSLPSLLGAALDPLVGLVGDTHRRRALIVAGAVAFAASSALNAAAVGFWTALVALLLADPGSGAFVGLARATLMDAEPETRERSMARWTAAGSVGYVAGPLLVAAAVFGGLGWRGLLLLLALPAVPLALAVKPPAAPAGSTDWRGFFAALRDREVLRRLALLEAADLMLDVFYSFLALYAVDVAGARPVDAAFTVAVWTGAGLMGDVLLLAVLRRMNGSTYLRMSALAVLFLYPAFLLVPSLPAKLALLALLGLLNAGWYALPKAALYDALPGRSGTAVAVGGVGGLAGAAVPAVLGALAGAVGLGPTMWLLLIAPVALLVGVRSSR